MAGLVDGSNQVVAQYQYSPWGELLSQSGTVEQPLRYGAREYDSETGLYFLRARYYDPQLGRFISEDPIGLEGGINPYAYVGNDPVDFTDPYGLADCVQTLVALQVERSVAEKTCAEGGKITFPVLLPGITIYGSATPPGGYGSYSGATTSLSHSRLEPGGGWGGGGAYHPVVNPDELWENPLAQAAASWLLLRGVGSATGMSSRAANFLFARHTGLLNKNPYIRIGYGWMGRRNTGHPVFRIAVGRDKPFNAFGRKIKIHKHFFDWPL